MKDIKIFCCSFIATVLAVLIFSLPAHAAVSSSLTSAPDFAAIDVYVQTEMRRAASPGLAYAIVENDEIVHMNAFGVADPTGRAVTPSTPFMVGSVGKNFTALAIRQLINAGRVDPNAPVQRYLPWFRTQEPPEAASITVQNLLDHRSGIPHWAGNQVYQLDERYTTEDLVRRANTVPLNSVPGTHTEYSNVNFLVLGLIIEKVSGQTYSQYVHDNIFVPLDMNHTYLDRAEAQMNGLASGYQSWYGAFLPVRGPCPPGMSPSGYSISTAEDMGKYLAAYLNHGISHGQSIVQPGAKGALSPAPDRFYDIYWNERPLGPNTMEGQSGGTLDFNGDIMIFPNRKLGVVVLMNSRWTLDAIIPTTTAASIAEGVARQVQGAPASASAPLTFRQWYLLIDAVLLLLVSFGVWEIAAVYRCYKRVQAGRGAGKTAVWLLVVDLVVAAGLLAVPFSQELALDYFLVSLADIAIVVCLVAIVLFLAAFARAAILITDYRRRWHPAGQRSS